MGWGKTAIDPRTVPRSLLLNRQSAPAIMGTAAGLLGIGRGRGRGQPFQPNQPMLPVVDEADVGLPRVPYPREMTSSPHSESEADSAGFPPEVTMAPSCIPNKDKPLPADPGLFAVGDDSDDDSYDNNYVDEEKGKGNPRALTPEPPAKYNTGSLPPGMSVVPELAHLAQGRRPSFVHGGSPDLEHPKPQSPPKVSNGPSGAHNGDGRSLVEKLTAAAQKMHIPNIDYFEYEGMYVPRIMTPPKGRRGRKGNKKGKGKGKKRMSSTTTTPSLSSSSSPSPSPSLSPNPSPMAGPSRNVGAINIAMAANEVPDSLIPGRDRSGSDAAESIGRSPSTYFVVTQPDANSPTGSSARVHQSPSHETVSVPPPRRLDGVLIPPTFACPHGHEEDGGEDENGQEKEKGKAKYFGDQCPVCRGSFFKERGLPSESYLQAECHSATLAQFSPVLVSVRVPERRYSCAVQSCYCDKNAEGLPEERCPSCRARDITVKELNMTWI
ncbi:hypothetical protein F5X97DRAFT_338372 [Nemania serpens]|nr:hypothetical protein F5X97DRAFT_338372 [Nemania serpens]